MQIIHSNHHSYGSYEQDYLNWYKRKMKNPGRPFDPRLLAQLVREQQPGAAHLADAFLRCAHEWPETEEELYTHFLSPREQESRWKYAGGFMLRHPHLGMLVVDTIHDDDVPGGVAIGGIEYLDRLLGAVRAGR